MIVKIKASFLWIALTANGLFAEAWVRGSATVLEASAGVKISVPAEGVSYDNFDQPVYFSGIFSTRAQPDGSVLLHTSNQLTLSFRGEGQFSVERFEGIMAVSENSAEQLVENRSRMILSLRRGELYVDSRALTEDSKFIIETPLGRISFTKAILLISIEHDYRSGIYDFTISSAQGMVRFNDLRKEVYTIYAGQRISGAGSYVAPAVEVGDQTDRIREGFDGFIASLDAIDRSKINQARLLSHVVALSDADASAATLSGLPNKTAPSNAKRPRVIEFAPRAKNISPFRAEIKPPSNDQVDLF